MADAARKGSRTIRILKWFGIGLVVLILGLVVIGTIWEQIERANARKAYPPPGRLVDISGRKMHIDCRGTGSPTIILEAGLDTTGSLAWDRIHDAVAKRTRACAYDRAGVMWSDPKPGPQDGEAVADDLHALLAAAHIEGPIVLVGHSLGGPYIMTYVRKYGDRVKGFVFVDTSHPDQDVRNTPRMVAFAKEQKEAFDPQALAAKFAWSGILRALLSLSDQGGPAGASERTTRIGFAYLPATIGGTLKEMKSVDATFKQAGRLRDLGDRPLLVLTAQRVQKAEFESFGMSEQDAVDFRDRWKLLHAEQAAWSKRSRQILVPDAGHYVQNERPDLVIGAVAEVVDAVRRADPSTAGGG